MKIVITTLTWLFMGSLSALTNYAQVYPPILQTVQGSDVFHGDRHGEFRGDDVAILSDGSGWKVHPDSMARYRMWGLGDIVRIALRTDWYWFSRQHHFLLVNESRGDSVKVMLAQHKTYPLTIVGIDCYYKSQRPVYQTTSHNFFDSDGKMTTGTSSTFVGYEPCDPRHVLILSDGSVWVIKDKFSDFQIGTKVYLGAQGQPGRFYDFVIISGDEREATWTMARPQK